MMFKTLFYTILLLLLAACGTRSSENTNSEGASPTTESAVSVPTALVLEGEAVIYVVGPLSGVYSVQGQSQAAGARLAASILNENGGLRGQRIVIRTINDQGASDQTLAAAQQIADESDDTLLGVVMTESSDPALSAVQQVLLGEAMPRQPLVVVSASTNPMAATVNSPLFFRLSADSTAQAGEIAAVIKEQNYSSAMVVTGTSPGQQALATTFENAAEDFGQTVLDTITVDASDTDFGQIAATIFEQNPAALFVAADSFETQQILSALYDINFQGAIFASDETLPYEVIDELGCQAEGLYKASVLPPPATVMDTGHMQRYASNEGRFPEPFSVAGYAAVEFIVGAYAAANSDEPQAAADYARNNSVTTLVGDLRFNPQGNQLDASIYFQQVQGRVFESSFQRVVGTPPQLATDSDQLTTTYLDLNFEADREAIVFADLNWSSALFHNAVARFIIESGYGYPTYAVPGSTVPSFQRLARGELDIIMERYNMDATVEEAITNQQILDLGVNFSDSVQGWFVPRYVVEGDSQRGIEPYAPDLRSIDDLDNLTRLFSDESGSVGQFFGGVPGWTAYKINCLKLKAYRLDDDYALVTSASTGDLFGALDSAYAAGDPVLVYLWSPTWPIARYDLIQLEEPTYSETCWETDRGCAYPTSDVRILVRAELPERAPDVANFLSQFEMDINDVSAVLLDIEDEGLSPDEAAIRWLQDNESVWSQWVTEDVTSAVKAVLDDRF